MAYVDLNPIRAKIADTQETSDYTSVQQRIREHTGQTTQSLSAIVPKLLGFSNRLDDDHALPYSLNDYLDLVDWSGRSVHLNKRGKISDAQPSILLRLNIDPNQWIRYLKREERGFGHVMGTSQSIRQLLKTLNCRFLKGISAANRLFPQQ